MIVRGCLFALFGSNKNINVLNSCYLTMVMTCQYLHYKHTYNKFSMETLLFVKKNTYFKYSLKQFVHMQLKFEQKLCCSCLQCRVTYCRFSVERSHSICVASCAVVGGAPLVSIPGTVFPVQEYYLEDVLQVTGQEKCLDATVVLVIINVVYKFLPKSSNLIVIVSMKNCQHVCCLWCM